MIKERRQTVPRRLVVTEASTEDEGVDNIRRFLCNWLMNRTTGAEGRM